MLHDMGTVDQGRTGVLVLRAWVEADGNNGLRVRITRTIHHVRYHIDVGLMVGSDVKGELPSTHLHLPSAQPPVLTGLGGPGEHKRAMEVWKVEPVGDDPLERHVGLADHSAVGPSIVAASPHTGHRGIAVWPSQHQRDWVARNRLNPALDPPDDLGVRSTGQLHHPGASSEASPPTRP